ncbi:MULTISPECIES: SGNH/GDSL hydrolase family protein [Bacillus cereus group]|uniref:SGNH/GDSL hydrolase family protein n=1 Tax=Bacillus cereus group TaxID=86661 RepID=UPI0022DF0E8D|nr:MULTISPECIES: SGNH/GDSL hydrolase family protein [Bacillus cereus group]MDA2666322.1 SGNH/GDSL hydrolase family protein [Bacillus cereus group sp. Bc032]MDA2677052.1 SGNH/GDSL hydrolase family protein [Bacillus cereus group sp. Bc031]MDA2682532.1 SGNH/GDSL hydrolase family protein [Bacillus cereus group sp. Bc029]MDA2687996.1 SGNH/GDSL hydrolase family protein [Bacillus cereus group sp. Bc030]MDA2743486.1 SGNH/GDSL hydrolase family protein [Bacillus cereus group sp. Bc011]
MKIAFQNCVWYNYGQSMRAKRGFDMRSKVVKVILLITIASFCLFAYGFVSGVNDVLNPKASNLIKKTDVVAKEKKKTGTLQIVSLGDSLTRGVGDKEGIGYVGRMKEDLQKDYKQKIALTNLAVSGAKMPDLLKQIESSGAQYSIKQADVIVLTIGGNDLFPGWESLGKIDLETYRPDTETFQNEAKKIIEEIRKLNTDSPIFWLGLYNPFEDVEDLKGASNIVVDWNASLEKLAVNNKNVYITPTFDLFQNRGKDLLYSDHFHPNEVGYTYMADRLVQNVASKLKLEQGGIK